MAYPTRPFRCWAKAKEDRVRQFQDVMTAKERGVPVTMGSSSHSIMLVGLGDFAYLPGEAYGAEVSRYPELATKCMEAVEHKGYASDLCGYLRMFWGSAFLRQTPWGDFPKPDFVIQGHHCDSHGKWFRRVADEFGVPYFVFETPERYHWDSNPEHLVQYEVDQALEFIEWLEKTTGKPYNHDALIDGIVNGQKTAALWAEILDINKAVPAPIDMKSMFALSNPAVRTRFLESTVDFYKELRDEVAERVHDGIASVANEKKRFMHDNLPPWFALHIFRFMEQYGAVAVASQYQFAFGDWILDEDHKEVRPRSYESVCAAPRPKDTVEALKIMYEQNTMGRLLGDSGRWASAFITKNWNIDGAIFHMNRGCEGWTRGKMEARLAVQELGIPTMIYEGNGSDKRDFNEAQVFSRLQAFFESMGLTRITN